MFEQHSQHIFIDDRLAKVRLSIGQAPIFACSVELTPDELGDAIVLWGILTGRCQQGLYKEPELEKNKDGHWGVVKS